MLRVNSAGAEDYDALRTRVQALKKQHVDAVQQQNFHRDVDFASIANRVAHSEAMNAALTAENEKLQHQLRQNTERSAKFRRQHEREEQKLREQVETLTAASSSLEQMWATKVAEAEAAAGVRVQHLESEMKRLKSEQEAELERLRKEHADSLQDVDEWTRGEIEAVQHNARAQIAQAHEAIATWQSKYDQESAVNTELKEALGSLQRQFDELRLKLESRDDELQQAKAATQRLQEQRAVEQAAAEEEKRVLKEQHCEQLEAKRSQHADQLAHIEGRLQAVVAKKDATIAALRAELKNTYSTLLPLKSM